MKLALDFFFVIIVFLGIFYFAVFAMRSGSSNLSSLQKMTPRKEEFQSTKPFEEWKTFIHPTYGYSISYPPELSITTPTPGRGEVLDMVRFFYGGRLAAGRGISAPSPRFPGVRRGRAEESPVFSGSPGRSSGPSRQTRGPIWTHLSRSFPGDVLFLPYR